MQGADEGCRAEAQAGQMIGTMSGPLPQNSDDAETVSASSGRSSLPWLLLPILLLFYVLSVGPAAFLHERTANQGVKSFLEKVYSPLEWMCEHTPLDNVVSPYMEWWERRADR